MGNASKVTDRMRKLAGEFDRAEATSVKGAGLASKTAQVAALRSVVPSGRLRNVGKNGARLGVRFDVKGSSVVVKATGPWPLVERPVKAHDIRPRRRGQKKAILTPAGPRASAQHPGIRSPLRPWARGKPAAIRAARTVIARTFSSAWSRGVR